MITVADSKDRSIAVMGLGGSGLATARALRDSGARVLAWDDGEAARRAAEADGIATADLRSADWRAIDELVLSPGIPHTFPAPHPVAARAREAGVAIICDIELLVRSRREARYFGITGTNGKSTTTALIGHVLEAAGRRVEIGGNLGPPVLALAPLGKGGIYVLELSSYQLERSPSAVFDVAVLLNVSPDHLDRHGGMDGYVAAKRNIFRHQRAGDTAIVGIDDDISRGIFESLAALRTQKVVPIAVGHEAEGGVYVVDGRLFDARDGAPREILDLARAPHLPGRHNWQNAAAAYAAGVTAGVEPARIADAFVSFPGLPHRQELIAVVDGVPFINDSKATNADAAAKALACYDNIYWIAGGRAKDGGIEALAPLFDRIARAFLIGEASTAFARTLEGRVSVTISHTLDAAVRDAHQRATAEGRPGAVVLLSPAGASFDQFTNFEQRGDAFRRAVLELAAAEGGR